MDANAKTARPIGEVVRSIYEAETGFSFPDMNDPEVREVIGLIKQDETLRG